MRISVKQGLVATILMLTLAIVGTAATSLWGARSLQDATNDISTNWLPSVRAAGGIEVSFFGMRVAYAKHILSLTPEDLAAGDKAVVTAGEKVAKAIEIYRPLISSPREAELLAQIGNKVADYTAAGEELVKLSRENKNIEATKVLNGTMAPMVSLIVKDIAELTEINVSGADKSVDAAAATFSTVLFAILVLSAISTIIAIASMYYAVKGISSPINTITAAMARLAGGDDESRIPFEARSDEIGAMSRAVEVFRQNSLNNKRLEQEAHNNRSEAEKRREAEEQRVAREAEQLRLATGTLGESLRRLASGDLTCRIETRFAEEYERLRKDFNVSIEQLNQTIGAVMTAARNMDSGTREIASGANDLSKRTEQQAASLEETAAALDEITTNVSSSSKMTEEARTVAQAATRSAEQSAGVVAHAEEAMQRIESSSQQISNIIGVIDEIAFQTNLLALNAGVEAARAGEAGKGFAVVAQEVRELAQRSAQAAKEIKGLIQNSTTEVESGVQLVRDTGEALKTIGGHITRINSHMESIATSAREQSVGLSEVNVAVNQMDQTTQQNAAMVEQSTAAAASLSQEAGKLRDLVARFQLEGGASDQVSMLRNTADAMAQSSGRSAPPRKMGMARGAGQGAPAAKTEEWQDF